MEHAITRRQLLHSGTALLVASRQLCDAANADTESVRVIERSVISGQPTLYHGWPTLTRRSSGQLVLVWSGGREAHVCPFGRVEMMVSDDDGRHWSWPRVVLDSDLDDRDAGVLETPNGTLLVTTFTSLAYEPILERAEREKLWSAERVQRWRAAQNRLGPQQRPGELGTWMIRSTDGGRSWSPRFDCRVNSPHGPIALADGRLLYAGKELWRGPKSRIGVCESRDDGRTWDWLSTIPSRPGDDPLQYHELHAVQAADGRIVAHIRNHNPANAGETLQSESRDGGKSWSIPRSIGVWGLPSHLLKLADGRLLMSYGHRRRPYGIQARISGDHGQSWSQPLLLSDDGHSGDLGYPTTVQFPSGEFLTVWYELPKGSTHAVLRQARWALNKVT